MELFLVKKGPTLKKCKNEPHTLSSNHCQSARECPNILKNWQTTNFYMGFQKNDTRISDRVVKFRSRPATGRDPKKFSVATQEKIPVATGHGSRPEFSTEATEGINLSLNYYDLSNQNFYLVDFSHARKHQIQTFLLYAKCLYFE